MRVREVRAAVQKLLNTTVPASSINEALSTHAREGDLRFHRLSYGAYEYRKSRYLSLD